MPSDVTPQTTSIVVLSRELLESVTPQMLDRVRSKDRETRPISAQELEIVIQPPARVEMKRAIPSEFADGAMVSHLRTLLPRRNLVAQSVGVNFHTAVVDGQAGALSSAVQRAVDPAALEELLGLKKAVAVGLSIQTTYAGSELTLEVKRVRGDAGGQQLLILLIAGNYSLAVKSTSEIKQKITQEYVEKLASHYERIVRKIVSKAAISVA